jgi:hypothetical protein
LNNPDTLGQLCTRDNKSIYGNNFTVGLWFKSTCGSFKVHDNTIKLKNETNPNLFTYGIVHDGLDNCPYHISKDQDLARIETTACKIMWIRNNNLPECSYGVD